MRLPRVYPILDTGSLDRLGLDWIDAAQALLEGGAEILQFRHKKFWSGKIVEAAEQIGKLCSTAGIPFVINDRADYAAMLNAGLHLGQDDLSPADARRVIGQNAFVGFSTHTPDQMRAAQSEPVDYVAFGPIFGTASKHGADPCVGIEGLSEMRVLTSLPLVAIGGINLENAADCWAAGADSVAVIAGLLPSGCTRDKVRDRMREWQVIGR